MPLFQVPDRRRDLTQLGNLSRHLHVLHEASLVAIAKAFDHNRPQTLCRITARGRKRYLEYLGVLEQIVRDAAAAAKEAGEEDEEGRERPGLVLA